MSLISPTTLLVAGSINITLSPAALVWTIRTVAASTSAVAASRAPSRTKGLVFIAGYFKLRSHAVDRLFRCPAAGVSRAGLRGLQGQGRAAAARKTSGSRTVCRLPFHRHGLSSPAAGGRREGLERGTV